MARLISAATLRPWSVPLVVVLASALVTLAALWWAWLTAAQRDALDSPKAVAQFAAANLPIVAGVAAASAGLHIAILAADGAGSIALGPRAALYGGVSIYLLAGALLPSSTPSRSARIVRIATSAAAMALVFMGAVIAPVYLVPALAILLVAGGALESTQRRRPQPVVAAAGSAQPALLRLDSRHLASNARNRARLSASTDREGESPNTSGATPATW